MTNRRRRIVTRRNGAIVGSILVVGTAGAAPFVARTFHDPDTTPPTGKLTSPAAKAFVYGDITLSASCRDGLSSCASVQFEVDSAHFGALDTEAPYQVTWPTADETEGTHTLSAIAYDSSGNVQVLSSRTVTVTNQSANEFVSTTGSDGETGCARHATPISFPADRTKVCSSIQAAYAKSAPGDKIFMGGGSYPGQIVSYSTAVGKPVHGDPCVSPVLLAPANGETATFTDGIAWGNGALTSGPDCFTIDGGGGRFGVGARMVFPTLSVLYNAVDHIPADRVTIKGVHITNLSTASKGIYIADTTHATIQDSEIGPLCCDSDAIQVSTRSGGDPQTANMLIDSVYIHDLYDTCNGFPTYLGTCGHPGFGDVGLSTTLSADMTSMATSITVSAGFSWLTNSTTPIYVQAGSEVFEVTNGFSTGTWMIKRPGAPCDQYKSSTVCSGTPAAHTAGTTLTIVNAFYEHNDEIQMLGCIVCTVSRSILYSTGDHRQGFFPGDGNCSQYTDITFENNFVSTTSDGTLIQPIGDTGGCSPNGFFHVYYNTILGPYRLYSISSNSTRLRFKPGATVNTVGNIFADTAGRSDGGGCTGFAYNDGTTLTPSWSHNLIAVAGNNAACDATDTTASAATILAAVTTPDFPGLGVGGCSTGVFTGCSTINGVPNLHLSTAGIALVGTAGENTYCPATDIDGDLRPIDEPCALGADQP